MERLAGLDGINYDGEFRIREGKRASHVKTLAEVSVNEVVSILGTHMHKQTIRLTAIDRGLASF